MSRDYDEEMGRPRAPRSRGSAARRSGAGGDGLKVMNDSSIHPVRTSGNGSGRNNPLDAGGFRTPERGIYGGTTAGRRQPGAGGTSRRSMAGGQTAATAENQGSVSAKSRTAASAGNRMAGRAASAGHVTGDSAGRRVSRGVGGAGGGMSGGTGGRGVGGAGDGMSGGSGGGRSGLSLRQDRLIAKRRKRRRIIAMILAECLTLACIFGYAYFLKQWNQLQRPEYDSKNVENKDISFETVEKMKGYWTIAIFGVDARNNAVAKGTNADVNMICNINLDTGEMKLVSVFRDTYLNISEEGSYNKINQAYFLGGPEQAVAALNRNLDLNITDYMTFNWKAVADAINILGGVDIELSKAEFYYINSFITETVKVTGIGSYQLKSAGMNHLDGVQAVAYGRLRLMDTDYARTERQRKVIQQAFEKARHADFNTLNRVLGTVFPQVATSINVDDIFTALPMVNKYHIGETTGFPQARGDAKMGKKGAVVVPQTLESNVVKLHEFLFGDENYTPSDAVKRISAKIAADSGMYKEGNYVDKVPTDGGVIQKPKTTTAAAADDDGDDEDNEDRRESSQGTTGESSRAARETDEDGNYLDPDPDDEEDLDEEEPETDRYGRPLGLRPGMSVQETDEDGNPIDPDEDGQPGNSHGGTTTPTQPGTWDRPGGTRPTGADESGGQTYPGGIYPGGSTHPGSASEPSSAGDENNRPGGGTSAPGSTSPTGGSSVPGSTTPGGGSSGPGGTHPTEGSSVPGSTSSSGESGVPGSPNSSGSSGGPGAGGPGQTTQVPGTGQSAPGSQGSSGGTGPVAGPGQ